MERKLSAILSADVKGYSRLMGDDEEATIRTLTTYREVMAALIHQHRGRVVDSPGDNLLADFASIVDAVRCAVEIQQELKAGNAELPDQRKMEFRMGINLGDVVVEGERIYGDGVNIAARLESLAEPGGICISGTVYDQIETKLALGYEYLGEQTVKNIAKPVRVWRVVLGVPSPLVGEGKGEGAAGRAGGTKGAEVKTPHPDLPPQGGKEPRGPAQGLQENRRMGTTHLSRIALVVVGLLIVGGIVTLLYSSFPTLRTPQSPIRNEEALPLPDKPSIAVLPFVNLSGDPEQEYFSDGMTEDLITDLSKLSGLFVIARNSTFVYKGKAESVAEVSRELGVRYVLEGSVRKADNQIRITAQLADATTGYHLWAEHYDRPLKDIFALQDEIRQRIVFALEVKLTKEEQERFKSAPTDSLEAYDYFLHGRISIFRNTQEANAQARQMCERAIELDSKYASAYALLAGTYLREWIFQWSQDPQNLKRAFELAQKAIALDDSVPIAHAMLGIIYVWRDRQHEQALAEAEKALALDPNYADGYFILTEILNFTGRAEEAIGMIEKAMRLDPHYPAIYSSHLGWAYALAGRYEKAVAAEKRALILQPDYLHGHLHLAFDYSVLGREEEARAEAAEALRINPNFSLEVARQTWPYKDPAVLERSLDALRKAGLK